MANALKRLNELATPGPWYADQNPMREDGKFLRAGELLPAEKGFLDRDFAERSRHRTVVICHSQMKPADADLIAYLRNNAHNFVALIEAAKKLSEQWTGENNRDLVEFLAPFAE